MPGLIHVTELALGECAFGIIDEFRSKEAGLREDTSACDGSNTIGRTDFVRFEEGVRDTIPTCPRCAVLRDAALEGRLPERNPIKENQP